MNTDKWTTKIDSLTAAFKQQFGNLSADQLNWKPNSETWSIGQNIQHLIAVNETYPPIIKQLNAGSYSVPFIGKIGFMVKFLGSMILGSVQPDRKRKMKTFPIWEPGASTVSADIVSRFEQHQAELKSLIIGCHNLLDKGAVISSPANKNIVYKLETAFDIIVTHEERHLEQAKEVLAALR